MKRKKVHLLDGSCKQGERGSLVSHPRFVKADHKACLTCARICGCSECYELERVFGSRVEGS